MFGTVIVGIDGYDGGREALAFARSLEPEEIVLISAYPVDPIVARASVRGYDELLRDYALRRLEAAAVDAGVDAERHAVADSSPARALQHAAQARDARFALARHAHEEAARAGPKIQLVVALLLVPSVLLLVAAALLAALVGGGELVPVSS